MCLHTFNLKLILSYSLFRAGDALEAFTSSLGNDGFGALGLLTFFKAATAALAMFNLFLDTDIIFAETSFMPASSITFLAALPAIVPLKGAGRIIIRALEYLASTSWGIDIDFVKLTLIIFFLAFLTALSMASAVSPALPMPTPTEPFLFPAIRATLKLNLLPPETTLATLLILIIFWSNSGLTRSARPPIFLVFFVLSLANP